jgi:5-methylcytosine-specific restriction endonuclease McrA
VKLCKLCGETKDKTLFWKSKITLDLCYSHCIECAKKENKERYEKNREQRILKAKEWIANNRERHQQFVKNWTKNNRTQVNAYLKEYRKDPSVKAKQKAYRELVKPVVKIKSKKYNQRPEVKLRARQLQISKQPFLKAKISVYNKQRLDRVPLWLNQNHIDIIDMFYQARDHMNTIGPTKFHIDHIVPLKGEIVSGLHVPWNLQILSEEENLAKSNRFE